MHSIELLKAEIEREEAALQQDRKWLKKLERESQAEQKAAERKGTKVSKLVFGDLSFSDATVL